MPMIFRDRLEAGRALGKALSSYAGRNDVTVLALPRGGVPVGFEVARALDAPLDVFLVRKLGLPGNEEYAIGAIASGGVRVLHDALLRQLHVPAAAVERVIQQEERELRRREYAYRDDLPAVELSGRTVILVDDGLATGSSMRAAVKAVRKRAARRIVVAVPWDLPTRCGISGDWPTKWSAWRRPSPSSPWGGSTRISTRPPTRKSWSFSAGPATVSRRPRPPPIDRSAFECIAGVPIAWLVGAAGWRRTTSNLGGSLRWRLTEHWSIARRRASRYFSGEPAGIATSIRIRTTRLTSSSHSARARGQPVRRQVALATETQRVEAGARPDRREEEIERRRRLTSTSGPDGLIGADLNPAWRASTSSPPGNETSICPAYGGRRPGPDANALEEVRSSLRPRTDLVSG